MYICMSSMTCNDFYVRVFALHIFLINENCIDSRAKNARLLYRMEIKISIKFSDIVNLIKILRV